MSELSARLDLPLSEQAPAGARRTIRQMLITWGYTEPAWLDVTCLVLAELVTNAVRHGDGCIELRVQAHENDVTVSAADGSAVVPRRREPGKTGGYGLAIIERLSADWGVENHQGGKRVWVRLAPYPATMDGASRADR